MVNKCKIQHFQQVDYCTHNLEERVSFPINLKALWLELIIDRDTQKLIRKVLGGFGKTKHLLILKRTVPSPMLKTLDAPEREFCTIRRSRTNTPLQALLLLNGTQFMEASIFLGSRMMLEGEGDSTTNCLWFSAGDLTFSFRGRIKDFKTGVQCISATNSGCERR